MEINNPDQSRLEGSDAALNQARMGTSYLAQGANKRSVAIDLKSAAGVLLAKKLISTADVVIDNFRPGAMDQLGLGPEACRACDPRLIYCSISGFGTTGPRSGETAYDNVIQAASGLMAMTGTPATGPLKAGTQVVDYATGMSAAFAIAAALVGRGRTGLGSHIDVSMYEVALTLATSHAVSALQTGKAPAPAGNEHRYASSCSYETLDGCVMLGASNLRQYRRLHVCLQTGWPTEAHRNVDRRELKQAEKAVIADVLGRLTSEETLQRLRDARVPASPVRNLADAVRDPQNEVRAFIRPLTAEGLAGKAVNVLMPPFIISGHSCRDELRVSRLGEDTWEVLHAAGISTVDLGDMRREGLIPI